MELDAAGGSQKRYGVPVNRFELRVHIEDHESEGGTDANPRLQTQIWIDGAHLDEPHPIDLPQLVQSLHKPGAYDIFTCSCGEGACAGIVEGIHVTHEGGIVRWSFRRPQSAQQLEPGTGEWRDIATPVHLIFRRSQMLNAVQSYLEEIRAIAGDNTEAFDWPVATIIVRAIIGIDPMKPCYDGH